MLFTRLGKPIWLGVAAFLAASFLVPLTSKADAPDGVRQLLEAFYRNEKVSMLDLAQAHQDPTYLTAGGGWNLSGNGNFGDQILEADLNPHFYWFSNHQWIKDTFHFDGFLNITGRIRLRMSSEQSAPVRTPSFMPIASYYFWFGDSDVRRIADYFSLMISHHSNGQDGPFYNLDGTVNTNSGSFSTNFLQLAHYHLANYKYSPGWMKISLDWHPGFNRSDELKDQYEKVKFNVEVKTRPISLPVPVPGGMLDWSVRNFSAISYKVSGRDYIVVPNLLSPGSFPGRQNGATTSICPPSSTSSRAPGGIYGFSSNTTWDTTTTIFISGRRFIAFSSVCRAMYSGWVDKQPVPGMKH